MGTEPLPNLPKASTRSALANKRIAFYTDDPGEGGVARYVHAMACGLAREGLDVTYIASEQEGPLQEIERKLGVKHCWLPFHTRQCDFARTALNLEDTQQVFAVARPDLVVFANCGPFSHIAAKQVTIAQNIPFVVVEGFAADLTPIDAHLAWRLSHVKVHYRWAKEVIAVSQDTLNLLRKHCGLAADKGTVIHYGRPEEYFRPVDLSVRQRLRNVLRMAQDDVLCLTVARLTLMKGFDCLGVALYQLRKMEPWKTLHFAWIGSGVLEKELRTWVKKLDAEDRVHFLGHRADVAQWLDAADVFLLPSRGEGMPLAIMEAMAKGLPVMASAVNGIPEEMGSTGALLSAPGNEPRVVAAEIVDALGKWVAQPELRRAIGQAGQARAESMFREERMVAQTRQVLERALHPGA